MKTIRFYTFANEADMMIELFDIGPYQRWPIFRRVKILIVFTIGEIRLFVRIIAILGGNYKSNNHLIWLNTFGLFYFQ